MKRYTRLWLMTICVSTAISAGSALAVLTHVDAKSDSAIPAEAEDGSHFQQTREGETPESAAKTSDANADEVDGETDSRIAPAQVSKTGDSKTDGATTDKDSTLESINEPPLESNNRLSVNPLTGETKLPSDYYGGYIDLLSLNGDDYVQVEVAAKSPRFNNIAWDAGRLEQFDGLPTVNELLDFSGPKGRNVCNTLECLRDSLEKASYAALDFSEPLRPAGPSQNEYFSSPFSRYNSKSNSEPSRAGTLPSHYRSNSELQVWMINARRWLWDAIRNPIVIMLIVIGYACAALVGISLRRQQV